jgi:hypothetical protein
MPEYLTIRDVFTELGLDESAVRRLIQRGHLKAEKVDRRIFPEERRTGMPLEIMAVHREELDRYLGRSNCV